MERISSVWSDLGINSLRVNTDERIMALHFPVVGRRVVPYEVSTLLG